MQYIFSEEGLRALEKFSVSDSIFAFDFDGTLAPIVSVPEHAKMNERTVDLIKRLSELRKVAVISGRSLDDLSSKVDHRKIIMVGNHGIEGLPFLDESLECTRIICETWLKELESVLDKEDGVYVEDKTFSLSVHYRNAKNKQSARRKALKQVLSLDPVPRIVTGKSVFNLMPDGLPNKGTALAYIMKEKKCSHAVYIGDDDTDEDIFALPHNSILKVRVGRNKSSKADFYIKKREEIDELIGKMIVFSERVRSKK